MSRYIPSYIKQWSVDENAAEQQAKQEFLNDLLSKTGADHFPKTKRDALALYDASKLNCAGSSLLRAVVGLTVENGKETTKPVSLTAKLPPKLPHFIPNQIKQWSKDENAEEQLKKSHFFHDLLTKTGITLFPKTKIEALALYENSKVDGVTTIMQRMSIVAPVAAPPAVAKDVPHMITNYIKQWSLDKDATEQQSKQDFFTDLLAKVGIEGFARTKADGLALYEDSKLDKAGTSLLRAAMHVPDHAPTIAAASKAKAEVSQPQKSAAKVIAAIRLNDSKAAPTESKVEANNGRKVVVTSTKAVETHSSAVNAAQEKSGKAPTTAEELERRQRRNGEPISFPTIRLNPIKVFCGGGKHCGYQVPYTPGEALPAYCDGHREKQATATKTRRVNHQCNWEDIVCVQNRCEISSTHLISALTYGCCPNCRLELHGGVITHFGLVLH